MSIPFRKKRKRSLLPRTNPSFRSLSTSRHITRAVLPVSDQPIPIRKRPQVDQLKLSQKIGILLFLNKEGTLSEGGLNRLYLLQRKAPEGAIFAGVKFCVRLSSDKKLPKDFKQSMVSLNRPFELPKVNLPEESRIGVGYRDKGSLLPYGEKIQRKSNRKAFIHREDLYDVSQGLLDLITFWCPSSFVDEEWIDLGEIQNFNRKLSSAFSGPSAL